MTGYRQGLAFVVFDVVLVAVTLLTVTGTPSSVAAQSIHIQSWNSNGFSPFGGNSIGISLGPIGRHHGYVGYDSEFFGYGYSGFGYPGLSYGYVAPYQSFGLSIASPYGYDTYRYQNDFRDYRNDYNQRLYDSYHRDLQRDLYYSRPRLDYGVAPYGTGLYSPYGDPSYYPPAANIEPFSGDEYRLPQNYGEGQPSGPVKDLTEALHAAANRLSISLSRRRDDGDVWLDYLSPRRIIAAIDQGLPAENVSELLQNFDGVVSNPELRSIATADGFSDTRRFLRQWVEAATVAQPEPPFAPEPVPDAESSDAPDIVPKDVPVEATPASQRTSV